MPRIVVTLIVALLVGVAPGPADADSSAAWDWLLGVSTPPSPPPAVDYLGLDAFDVSKRYVRRANTAGIETICYVSAGTLEDWRPDRKSFENLNRRQVAAGKPTIIGRRYPEWPDERWLNVRRYRVFMPLMMARIELCADKGFGLVEFDNIDGHANRTGFDIRRRHSIRYARALAGAATDRGLAAVQKNVTELNRALEPHFGALLLESCVLYRFCGDAARYRQTGKPVFNAEYPQAWREQGRTFRLRRACETARAHDIALIAKKFSLNDWIRRCR